MPLRKDRGFDLAKLQAMIEPIGVRVEKLRNSTKMPIELPPKDGAPSGIGWTRDEIMKLEGFLLNQWSGGGYYTAKIADAEGNVMEWDFGWDPKVFPEKNPPTQVEATVANPNNNQPVAPSPTQGPLGSSTPTNFPPPAYTAGPTPAPVAPVAPAATPVATVTPPQTAAPQYPFGYTPTPSPYTPPPSWYWGNGSRSRRSLFEDDDDTPSKAKQEAERAKHEAEERVRRAEARLQELEREKMQEAHKSELERLQLQQQSMLTTMQQESAKQIQALQDELRKISETRNADPEKEALRREIEAAKERNLQVQMEQMRQTYEQQTAMLKAELERRSEDPGKSKIDDLMRVIEQQREESNRQLAKQKEDFERERERAERIRAEEKAEERHREEMRAMNEKLEKTITAMQAPRQDPILELMKEQARQQTEMAREQARAQESQITKFAPFMVSPIQLAQLMKDNSSQADQVLNKVVQSFGGIFDTYRGVMESVAQVTGAGSQPSPALGIIQDGLAHAKEVGEQFLAMKRDSSVAEAKARAAEAAAKAEASRAQSELVKAQSTALQLQAAQGAQSTNNLAHQRQVASAGLNGPEIPATATPTATVPAKSNGHGDKRELDVFGAAYEDVKRLQKGVLDGHLNPEQVINALLQGVAIVQSQNMNVPAFELLAQERFADLIDLMIPQATVEFRQECVDILLKKLDIAEDDDDDEDENGDSNDVESPAESTP